MELIIAIVIVLLGVAIWYSRRAPANTPVVETETSSDNGIKFVAPEPAPVVVTIESVGTVEVPVKAPRAKKPAAPKAPAKKAPAKAKKPAAK